MVRLRAMFFPGNQSVNPPIFLKNIFPLADRARVDNLFAIFLQR